MNKRTLTPRSQERLNSLLAKMESSAEDDESNVEDNANGDSMTLQDVFSHSLMRKCVLIMLVNWTVVTLGNPYVIAYRHKINLFNLNLFIGYFGLSMISTSIGNDAFTSTILSALIEIPSYIFVYLFVDNFGRKPIMVCTLFLTGVSCIPAGYVTGHIQMALSLAGKNQVYIPVLE